MGLDDEGTAPTWMFKAALALAALFFGLAVALVFLFSEEDAAAGVAPPEAGPALIVFESDGCGWCTRFRERVAPAYERSHLEARAPLRYLDIGEARRSGYRLKGRINGTPTFVLVDREGREAGRIPGYPGGPEVFLPEVERLLGRLGG